MIAWLAAVDEQVVDLPAHGRIPRIADRGNPWFHHAAQHDPAAQ